MASQRSALVGLCFFFRFRLGDEELDGFTLLLGVWVEVDCPAVWHLDWDDYLFGLGVELAPRMTASKAFQAREERANARVHQRGVEAL